MGWQVCLDQPTLLAWLAEKLPPAVMRGMTIEGLALMRGIGYQIDGKMVAAVAFSNHQHAYRSIHVHWALELPAGNNGSMLRGILRHAALYPFEQLNCRLVIAMIPRRERKARKVALTCGFVENGKIPQAFLSDDAVVYTMLRHRAPGWLYTTLDAPATAA